MHESGAVVEFLDETWEILDSLSAACAEGKGPTAFSGDLKTIERNLHTIKGNAAAFGFEELSGAASRTLDWLRGTLSSAGKTPARPQDLPPVLEFTARLRQYLALLNPDAPPLTGFWSETPAPKSQATRSAGNSSIEERREPPVGRAAATPDWEAEVKEILSRAPLVTPQIDDIVWMAIQKLTGKNRQGCGELPAGRGSPGAATMQAPVHAVAESSRREAPPTAQLANAAGGTNESPLTQAVAPAGMPTAIRTPRLATACAAPAVHAYAFEATVKAEWLRCLEEKCHSNSVLEGAISEISDILASFGRWSVETRVAPLSNYLPELLAPVKNAAHPSGFRQRVELTGGEIPVLPPVGKLIGALLRELLGPSVAPPGQDRETPPSIKIDVLPTDSSIELSVSGLGRLERAASRLQLDLLRQRIERCGVSLTRSAESAGESRLLISLPIYFDGIEVLIVRAGDRLVGLPNHRVHATLDLASLNPQSRCENGRLEAIGESLQLLDLSAASESGAPQGEVVLIQTDKERGALKVDKVLHREEMILVAPAPEELPGAAFSLCLSIEQLEWMPFLWCSSRLFEQQESLGSRP